jgi:hypothetical protein
MACCVTTVLKWFHFNKHSKISEDEIMGLPCVHETMEMKEKM